MSSAAIPAAMGVAVDVPSLRIVRFDLSYPCSLERVIGQAAATASPRMLYFSSPSKGGLNRDRLPYVSADPMQKMPWSLAGKVIRSLAPTFEAEAKTRTPVLRASLRTDAIDGTS